MSRARKGFYQHYKGGIYRVFLEDAVHSETAERMVIYATVSDDAMPGQFWARPAEMFEGLNENGVLRFRPITAEETGEIIRKRRENI